MAWILAVDDEEGIRNLIQNALEKDGHRVSVCKNTEVIKEKDLIHYDLILLDIMMPGTDGITWCKKIRRYVDCPILFLTAKAEEKSIMEGLGSGGDDYICKPYDIDILIAKINGIFKRKYALDEIVCDNLKLNNVTQTLTVNQTPVNVTEKEFQLLKLLVENKGTTLKKEYLFNRIWGSDSESEPQTLTVHIKWLREKIEKDSKKPKHIITVWGTGYRYE